MSDSRLEKFIYAICSMDVSDLPVPLSRIEKLWNCLITGETPDFEPLSRNEKYLMAMLDRYDISNLPAPMSRGEKLLYKIAVGETDLSDVPGYLSRYEELLKYLIENGVLSDFEYVLYTLNQSLSTLYATVEKPVKSAILKGQTLVNIFDVALPTEIKNNHDITLSYQVNANETYTFIVEVESTSEQYQAGFITLDGRGNGWRGYINNGFSKFTVTTSEATNKVRFSAYGASNTVQIKKCTIIKGDYSNQDIPFFTGMQSVKMPVLTTSNVIQRVEFETIKANFSDGSITPIDSEKSSSGCIEYFDISKLTNAKFVFRTTQAFKIENYFSFFFYDKDMNYLKCVNGELTKVGDGVYSSTIPTVENAKYLRVIKYDGESQMSNIIKSSISAFVDNSLSIDPTFSIKTNILSTSEDVTLRGIDDVKDTLDGNTGELTQRIGEDIFDGSEDWIKLDLDSHPNGYYLKQHNSKNKGKVLTDKIKTVYSFNKDTTEAIYKGFSMAIFPPADINELTLFKQWLSQNPITVQYELAAPTIKTVDLTTIDQDGQPTKLKTFNDITNVEIKADSLIPSVDLEVATKISETLSTLGLEHHDISETQNKLGQTIDEQTENTDATMLATTEIYENL